jgi:hypothetical protein
VIRRRFKLGWENFEEVEGAVEELNAVLALLENSGTK